MRRRKEVLIGLALVHMTCNQAILTAPLGATMLLFANPEFIASNGGRSVITAVLTEDIGTPVADGTIVQFFTNLGMIDEQGRTNDGVARVNFTSDSRSGLAEVTALSGVVAETTDITIGSSLPFELVLTANPNRLTDRRASRIVATVIDEEGNPVPNVQVLFSVDKNSVLDPELQEFMESRGSPVFTDNNGRATDVMRTRAPFGGAVRVVEVEAVVLGRTLLRETVDVTIN